MKKTILIFGNGYVTEFLSKELASFGWRVYSTSRQMEYKSHTEYPDYRMGLLKGCLPYC